MYKYTGKNIRDGISDIPLLKQNKNYQCSGTNAMVFGHQDFHAPPDLTGHSNFGKKRLNNAPLRPDITYLGVKDREGMTPLALALSR